MAREYTYELGSSCFCPNVKGKKEERGKRGGRDEYTERYKL